VIKLRLLFPNQAKDFDPANPPRHLIISRNETTTHLILPYNTRNMPLLEIACFNVDSALIAQDAGADRVELCKDQELGGTTPLLSTFKSLKDTLSIPIYVMIRPHGRDFKYSDVEYRDMGRDIEAFKRNGARGFVFGILNEQGTVDGERCRDLLLKAEGRPCTFHRAFDEIIEHDMLEQLELLMEVGFRAVLTSGGKTNAVEGKGMIKSLVAAAKGRIDVIAGGGVRSSNLGSLRQETNAPVFHSSAIVDVRGSETASKTEIMLLEQLLNE
jgi:copper homeostasis protein